MSTLGPQDATSRDTLKSLFEKKEVLLVDIWLIRFFYNILDSLSYTTDIGSHLLKLIPENVVSELEISFRHFAKTGAPLPKLLSSALRGVTTREDIAKLKEEITTGWTTDFAHMLDIINVFDKNFSQAAFIKQLLATYWITPLPCLPGERDIDPYVRKLMIPVYRIMELFELSAQEVTFLMHLYCRENDTFYSSFCDTEMTPKEMKKTVKILQISLTELKEMISPARILRSSGLVIPNIYEKNSLSLDPGITEYFNGIIKDPFQSKVYDCETAKYPLSSFSVDPGKTETLLSMLGSEYPRHILLYGTPGTGKTEYCKALISVSGRKGKMVKIADEDEGSGNRLFVLALAARSARMPDDVVIIDECDALLGTEEYSRNERRFSSGRAWLNNFLDTVKVSTIWILNDVESVHESVKRRFHYSVHFDALPEPNRLSVWERLATEAGYPKLAKNPDIESLLRIFQPSPADMTCILKALEGSDENHYLSRITLALEERSILMKGKNTSHTNPKPSRAYDPEALSASIPIADLKQAMCSAIDEKRPLTLLFYGGPGTGKTELAKYLAAQAGRQLEIIRASDLLSPYVGDTEQNIAAMFRNAEKKGTILLLDEADSFLRERRRATHAWEVTQVNELLTQMEVFQGIFIACTNLIMFLDKAVMRRFSIKVHFDALNDDGRLRLFAAWFPNVELNDTEKPSLFRIKNLAPGDFHTVHAFLTSIGRTAPHAEEIIAALVNEASFRSDENEEPRKIGF